MNYRCPRCESALERANGSVACPQCPYVPPHGSD